MKQKLKTALVVAVLAGIAGAGVAVWQKSEPMTGIVIVIVTSIVGFFFGLVFRFDVM
jgi:hypothetical protein